MRTRRALLRHPTTGAAMICLLAAGCGLSRPDEVSTARTTRTAAQATGTASVQPDAPYPADTDHLDDILATGDSHDLPQGAQVTSISPGLLGVSRTALKAVSRAACLVARCSSSTSLGVLYPRAEWSRF